jgi:NTE family protein
MAPRTRAAADLPATGSGHRVALVLSGGGARGAYEAGVLQYVLDDLPARLGRPVAFDVVTGSSVGAIHACWVAGTSGQRGAGARLAEIWRSLDMGAVYRWSLSDLATIPLRALGIGLAGAGPDVHSRRIAGLLDTGALERLVYDRIPWEQVRRNVDDGVLDALAIAATEIETGKSVVWVDQRADELHGWSQDPFVVAQRTRLTPDHALASAAIPFLFPAVQVDGWYYCDGGLRLNTPLAPALRLGADRLLIVGLRHVPTAAEHLARAREREQRYASLPYLAGKVLNALLLDHVDYDVDRLRVVNAILDTGLKAFGPEFLTQLNATVERFDDPPYRVVSNVYLQPSKDLDAIAEECLGHMQAPAGLQARVLDVIVRRARAGAADADLLSYLLFDHCYAQHLIELGHADAAAHADALAALFEGR